MSEDKEKQWKEHNEMIMKGAQAILDWAYELSQDYLDSILEDILPDDIDNKKWWELAHECRDKMGYAILPEE